MSLAYVPTTDPIETKLTPREMGSQWVVQTMAPYELFGPHATKDQGVIDEVINRLLDEVAWKGPYAKGAEVLLFRASMAGKISVNTQQGYDILLPPKKVVRRARTSDEVATARRKLAKNREARGEDSRYLKAVRTSKAK